MSWPIDNRGALGGQLGWFSKKSSLLRFCVLATWSALSTGCGTSRSKLMLGTVRIEVDRSSALNSIETKARDLGDKKRAERRWKALWSSPSKITSRSHLVIQHAANKAVYGKASEGFHAELPRRGIRVLTQDPSPPPQRSTAWLDVQAISLQKHKEKTIPVAKGTTDDDVSRYRVATHQTLKEKKESIHTNLLKTTIVSEQKPEKKTDSLIQEKAKKDEKAKKSISLYERAKEGGRTKKDKKAHSQSKPSQNSRFLRVARQIGCASSHVPQSTRRSPTLPKKPCLPKLLPFSNEKQKIDLADIPVAQDFAGEETKKAQSPQGVPSNTGLDWHPSTPLHIGMPSDTRFRWVKRLYGSRFWGFTWVMLKRRSLFEHRMRPLLQKEGVPEELFLLTGVESNYNVRLLSRAYAVGLWQIIEKTGLRYGLQITSWIDERRHIEKATIAAARYLRDLYQRYGQWEWALAAYNCGEWCIDRVLQRCSGMTYWQARLRRGCGLPQETKDYVARYYSVLYYYRNYPANRRPVVAVEPLRLVAVKTPGAVCLREVAEAINIDLGDLFHYNSELSSWATPPGEKYPLLVPPAYAQKLREHFAGQGGEEQPWRWKTVRIGAEKSIKQIAKKYDITTNTITILNRVRGNIIPEEQKLLILPIWRTKGIKRNKKRSVLDKLTAQVRRFRRNYPALRLERKLVPCYRARKGDTWRQLSRRHGVAEKLLMHYNGFRPLRKGVWIRLRQWARCHPFQKRKNPARNGNVALLTPDSHD